MEPTLAHDESAKETFKFPEFPPRVRMNRTNSKEKICNDQSKGKSNSKLPRIVRTPSKFYKPTKSSAKLNTKLADSGDSLPGPSRLTSFPMKMKKEEIPEKLKTSHIPRRKSNKEGFKDTWESAKKSQGGTNNNQFPQPECRNIQRVQMLINPEFCPEDRTQPTSVASSRPIPTLGQIYGRINMIDSDRLNDWFMELNTPINSITSNPRTISLLEPHMDNDRTSSTVASPANCHQENLRRSTIVLNRKDNTVNGFKTTNENVGIWLSSDVEFPTRDNESGYRTMSIKNAAQKSKQSQSEAGTSQAVKSNNTYCMGLKLQSVNKTPSAPQPSVECSTGTSSLLKEQQTVVLCRTPETAKPKVEDGTNISKVNVSLKPTRMSKTDANKNHQFPSNVNHTAVIPSNRIPVASYTECLSEILQKTTNFENMEGLELAKTPSSAAVTDGEIRDNLSNEGTLDAMDEFGVVEDQSNPEWCRQQCQSNGNMTFVKSDATVTDWSCRYQSEASGTPCSRFSDDHHHHYYSWNRHDFCKRFYEESHNVDSRDLCRCQRFKRFPSSRYKLPRTFGTWRQRLSIRRICRRRWNRVWKKTAERWASWSCRNAKFRRFHVMQYLQRAIVWEDADVQTNIVMYSETGTGSTVREQKSAAIGTVVDMELWQAMCNRNETVPKSMSNKSKFKHVNLGPSMFPFLHNSKRKSLTLQTAEKGQSGSQFPNSPENDGNQSKTLNNKCTWNTNHATDVCNSVKSCQYQGAVNIERSTSLFRIYEANFTDERTDTEDLPSFMKDKVTSTLLRISAYRVPKSVSKDAYTQKIILCHNAETDVTFLPNLGNSSTGTLTSGCDITYYRPLTGSDITHLITETRTQQALYPILRKFNSNATAMIEETSAEMETQMSPDVSVNTMSTGVSTPSPKFTEKTTSYTNGSVLMRNSIEKQEFGSQTEESKLSSTDTETQMTPDSSKSIISTGITPSSPMFGNKASTFISACVLWDNEIEKEHYAVQAQPPPPNLALTATKIMSISSRQLTDKDNVSSTEVTIDKPSNVSATATSAKCLCKPCEVSSCSTETKSCMFNCTRSTSAKGLESYFETETLLNNLIKKALVGEGGSYHSQYSDRSEGRDSNKGCIYVTTSTSTHIGLETKAIGPTASDVNKLSGSDKTDTAIQYVEVAEKLEKPDKSGMDFHRSAMEGRSQIISMCMLNQTMNDAPTQTEFYDRPAPPLLYKCASVMTSYCGLPESVQVPASITNVEVLNAKPQCACALLSCNIETNTDYGSLPNLQLPTQSCILRTLKTKDVKSSSAPLSLSSRARLHNNLLSISRLIGKKRASATIEPPVTTPIFSSDITADKWIKKCASVEKNYESLMGLNSSDEANKKAHRLAGPLALSLSKDSLADVLPVKKSKDFYSIKKQNTQQSINPRMVDEVTSDDNVTKDVKESILQACPEICETGTESLLQMYQQRSACVLTTQCVLPSPSPCNVNAEHRPTECVFVYGEPRCVIHKSSADAAVQIEPTNDMDVNMKKRECVNHSVGILTSFSTIADVASQRKPSTLIREVLSPKVYKALYETTKLVVSEDTKQPPVRDTSAAITASTRVDTEVEAAKFHMPDVRSAGVVTSVGHGFGFPQRCYCRDRGTHARNKCTLYHVTKADMAQTTSHFTHAKLLQMPEQKEGCFEDCMKTHLVTSCRYYSNLLTKQLGRVKENLTKHLAQPIDETAQVTQVAEVPAFTNNEACTMKPSGRTELASQTLKFSPYYKTTRHISCCVLSPAMSLTDICKHDKDHLKSVYYMLSAIEGRLRRLKLSAPPSF